LDKKHFTSQELRDLFQAQPSGYAYHPHYFSKLLREKLGMYYYKPEPRDYRQSPEAEAQLQMRIQATLDALAVMGKEVSQMAIGFADESAAQFHANNARFWSLEPHLPRPINSELGSQKFFGFYALVGNSILERMQGCKGEDFKPFLQAICQANPDKKGVILFWDNATSHHKVEQWAWTQGIYIICLPPYSPDLNPIERVWKSCKRWLNEQPYCKKKNELATLFEKAYDIYKVQLSFADGWLKKMQSIFSWICPIQEAQTNPT
jgi:transposase